MSSNNGPIVLTKNNKLRAFLAAVAATIVLLILLYSGLIYKVRFIYPFSYIGFGLMIFVLMMSIFVYMLYKFKEYLLTPKYLIIVYSSVILTILLCGIFENFFEPEMRYARPLLLSVLLISQLLNSRFALFTGYIVNVLLLIIHLSVSTAVTTAEPVLLSLAFIMGMVAALLSHKNRRRIEYLLIALELSVIYTVFSIIYYFVENNPASFDAMLRVAGYAMSSGFVNVFIFLGVLPLFESGFNIVTNFRLGELTDHNRPLLRKLKEQAPGTFNHSLVLGNIAEACASAIGENTYLARAAAYYHDIGKLKNPQYFIENQYPGNNPHDELSPEMSASLIKKHIQNGVAMAKEYKLPREIINVIKEHHGTLSIKYFYYKAQKYTDGLLDEKEFCYDGPKPTSKISAIILIADGSEAAIRSAKDAGDEVKEKIVNDIIKERMDRNQFSDCNITMSDIERIKETILTTFAGVFHERIAYPTAAAVEE